MGEYLTLLSWQELGCVISPLLLPTTVPLRVEGQDQIAAYGPSCMVTQLGAVPWCVCVRVRACDAESGVKGATGQCCCIPEIQKLVQLVLSLAPKSSSVSECDMSERLWPFWSLGCCPVKLDPLA